MTQSPAMHADGGEARHALCQFEIEVGHQCGYLFIPEDVQ